MTRSFYTFAIYLGILCTLMGLVQGALYFSLGRQLYSLESFPSWYLTTYTISILLSVVLLKYFRDSGFMFSFAAGVALMITTLIQFVVAYGSITGVRSFAPFNQGAAIAVLVAEIAYAVSLIFSRARKRFWLKAAGYLIAVYSVVLLSSIVGFMNLSDVVPLRALDRIHQWAMFAIAVTPFLFTLNFRNELKEMSGKDMEIPRELQAIKSVRLAAGLLALFFILVTGSAVSSQAFSRVRWERQLATMAEEWRQVFDSRTFTGSTGSVLHYQLLGPDHLDHDKKYPLFVGLPYNGGVEGCPPVQWLLSSSNRENYPAFLFVPFCPDGAGWGGVPDTPAIDTLVFECILALEKEFEQIDAERIYVSGVSRGGYGAWHFIAAAPDLFAAAVPVCGGGDPALAPVMQDVAVWAFHGEEDKNVPVQLSRDMIAAMDQVGANPRYTEYEGKGHDIWQNVKSTQGLLDWLFEQKRRQ